MLRADVGVDARGAGVYAAAAAAAAVMLMLVSSVREGTPTVLVGEELVRAELRCGNGKKPSVLRDGTLPSSPALMTYFKLVLELPPL